jgi:Retroviral aspartyl protease.
MAAYDTSLFNLPAPLAKVTLRNQDNGTTASDVPMLLDTGADVTLIPQSSVNQLGLTIEPNEGYELMSFDGSTSVAQVVRVDLILLRRVFRGRFLITDQAWGILGRDILNHLSMVFDGPRLSWSEANESGK